MGVSINERLGDNEIEFYNTLIDKVFTTLRVSVPGIIRKFDHVTQTAEVQVALREHVRQENMEYVWTEIPPLQDVPVVFPRGGGYALTFPIKEGDECLIVFSDMCIDAWFSSGGVQNQIEKRRHDLSDAICIPGLWSQPKKLENFSRDAVHLRSDDGSAYISLTKDELNIVVPRVKINGINFGTHTHYAPNGGGQTSGPS
ncbi:Gp138 family membrane-puncturing spike protein [Brevibacillus borstelensis]|uniref:Gp138 family membrane-puncturing spike protein n=1 Tax=Brevibacillus borstelensis TaxID=45462 RepID=UPI0004F36843|nr:Gp138 family membrane-puncturing spike protein [Brevibacillus borstelensis]KKX52445.1 hypothetical protein X546_25385 [Brevibacillus borstelensis cifa_chp40]